MSILEVAKDVEGIMAEKDLKCPVCGDTQYAPYDKLFTKAYNECPDCNSDEHEEYLRKGTNILKLLEDE